MLLCMGVAEPPSYPRSSQAVRQDRYPANTTGLATYTTIWQPILQSGNRLKSLFGYWKLPHSLLSFSRLRSCLSPILYPSYKCMVRYRWVKKWLPGKRARRGFADHQFLGIPVSDGKGGTGVPPVMVKSSQRLASPASGTLAFPISCHS